MLPAAIILTVSVITQPSLVNIYMYLNHVSMSRTEDKQRKLIIINNKFKMLLLPVLSHSLTLTRTCAYAHT